MNILVSFTISVCWSTGTESTNSTMNVKTADTTETVTVSHTIVD